MMTLMMQALSPTLIPQTKSGTPVTKTIPMMKMQMSIIAKAVTGSQKTRTRIMRETQLFLTAA